MKLPRLSDGTKITTVTKDIFGNKEEIVLYQYSQFDLMDTSTQWILATLCWSIFLGAMFVALSQW